MSCVNMLCKTDDYVHMIVYHVIYTIQFGSVMEGK